MRPDIYGQHDQAFRDVSAYVVANSATGERIATIAFKYARSGLRTTVYLHVLGAPMVRAYASGGGYDKESAAMLAAVRKLAPKPASEVTAPTTEAYIKTFQRVVKDEGSGWNRELKDAGLNVMQAV